MKTDWRSWTNKTIDELNVGLFERKEIIASTLLTVLSGQSVFLYGPPGTAKSLISRRISCAFSDSKYFEYLMQRFSTPEELFGPVDIGELKKNNYVRDTENYLPTADIAFLDEIWKSSPAILNTLLTIINERKFKNGKQVEDVPLKALIAASNEFPQKNSGLDALYDRFIMRLHVGPLNSEKNFLSMICDNKTQSFVKVSSPISNKEWTELMSQAHGIKVPKQTLNSIKKIRKAIDLFNQSSSSSELYISDRRWQKAVYVLKMAALLSGRDEVWESDLFILKNALWSSEDDKPVLEKIICDSIDSEGYSSSDYSKWKEGYDELKKETEEIFRKATKAKTVSYRRKECYKTKGQILVNSYDSGYGYYYQKQQVPFTSGVPYGCEAKTVDYYFIKDDIVIGGSGQATVTGGQKYTFSVIGIDKGVAKVKVNNQVLSFNITSPASIVSKNIKTTYLRSIQGSIESIDSLIKETKNALSEREDLIKSPFISDSDAEHSLKSMQSVLNDMEKSRIDAKSLLSSVKSHATQ